MMDAIAPLPSLRSHAVTIGLCAVLVIAAWAALELWGLGKTPFHTKGEPREGLVVWEMTHGGGWILPRRNGVELPSKPPLFHWLGAATSLLHGATDEWSIRFPSAALSLAGLLLVFAAGAALWTARAGLISALALMTTFEWARAATGARVDMTLTFGLDLAFLSVLLFLRTRTMASIIALYTGITLAVLGKGPVGAALPGLLVLSVFALTRDFAPLLQMRLGYGAIGVAVCAGSWYVMALLLGGWAFFRKQVLAENVFTFLDNPEFGGGHRHTGAYLLGALLLGLLPWTPFLPGIALRLWRQRRDIARHDARVFLLVWIVIVFAFYAIAASKRSVYLLALYPAVALLLGWWWDQQIRAGATEDRWLGRFTALLAWILMAVVSALFLAVLLEALGAPLCAAVQRFLPAAAQPFTPAVSQAFRAARWELLGFLLLAAGALFALARVAAAANWTGVFVAAFVAVSALMLCVSQVMLPVIAEYESLRGFMADVRQVVDPADNLFFYKTFEYEAVFYWGAHIPRYDGPWPAGAPRYLLMTKDDWERARASAQNRYHLVTMPQVPDTSGRRRLVLVRRIEDG